MIFKKKFTKKLKLGNLNPLVFFALIVLMFGVSIVWLDIDEKIDSSISESSRNIEKDLDVFWHSLESVVQSRVFLTNLSFNVNLVAMDELDLFVEKLSFIPNIFIYDQDKGYFGKNTHNKLNRFAFKMNDLVLQKKHLNWRFFELNGERYIERYKKIYADGKTIGYLRVVFSIHELQEKIVKEMKSGAHLSIENNKYSYVRCELSKSTDLLVCVPLDFENIVSKSGTMMAFIILFWAFLGFVILFYFRGRLAQARAQTLVEVSSQVSHDIQSPLLALKVATKALENLPEEQRLMVQRSISRIEDIVNDLRNKRDNNLDHKNRDDHHLLYGLVNSILSEKRLQYKYRNIELDLFVKPGLQTSFVRLNHKNFKRVLSNIINNAVEAIPEHGNVGLEIDEQAGALILKVVDNGVGIAESQLKNIFAKGVSLGKEKGQGLGLFHAKKMADSWGAELSVLSVEGKGTSIELRLPKAKAPAWFPRVQELSPETQIVVIDDDQNIHEVWVNRFEEIGAKNKIVHFYHIESAESRLAELNISNTLFLVDYELIHSSKSGLDFIEKNNLRDQSILVTARYDDENILDHCLSLGISLLPKVLISEYDFLNIVQAKKNLSHLKLVESGNNVFSFVKNKKAKLEDEDEVEEVDLVHELIENVLIDDDPLVRKVWCMRAEAKDVDLLVFESIDDFLADMVHIPHNANIFIDVDLGDGVRGDECAKKLCDMGYKNLVLTTGYDDISIADKPWLKDSISKEPPF